MLKDRLDGDPRILGSTSFADLKTANKYTEATIFRNAAEIEKWLGDAKAVKTQSFIAEFNEPIGYGFNKNGQYFGSISTVKVVIKKTEDGFLVYTAHPLVDKVK